MTDELEAKPGKLILAQAQDIADELVDNDRPRDEMFASLRRMYAMDWKPANCPAWMQVTRSPAAFNAVRGVCNLLLSTDPNISVPVDKDNPERKDPANQMEQGLRLIIEAGNKQRLGSIAYDAVFLAALYGLIVIKATRTSDTAAAIKGPLKEKYTEIAEVCPFVFDVPTLAGLPDPSCVHYQLSPFGLSRVVEVRERMAGDVRAEWGLDACATKKDTEIVEYFEYWDRWQSFVWTDHEAEPLHESDHERGYLPYVIQPLGEPLLYGVHAGGLWQLQNIALTSLASAGLNLAFPSIVTILGPNADKAEAERANAFDWTMPGQNMVVSNGTQIVNPFEKMLGVSAALLELMNRTDSLIEQSTLSRIVFGQAPESVTAYSAINTLLQGARLPLTQVQVAAGWALSRLCELILRWVKDSNEPVNLYGHGKLAELNPDIIEADHIEVKVELKPSYPQDRLQAMNVATMGVDKGLMSRERAIELTGSEQPTEELKKIVGDAMQQALIQSETQRVLREVQQAQQFPVQGEPQGPVTPEQMMMEQQAAMQQQQGMQVPTEQNLPPGMSPVQMGVPPEAQIMSAAQGGGPPIEEAMI